MRTDLLIAGGGLSAALLALAIRQRRPGTRVTIVEAGARLGGNHVWSFFASDVAPADRPLVDPLVSHRWGGYRVAFPGLARDIANPYHSIESERLDLVLRSALPPADLLTGTRVRALDRGNAFLEDGRVIGAEAVIDARNLPDLAALDLGWQKFVGRTLRLAHPHGLDRPTVMDATVDQADGYRFVYLLPFDERRVFVEDTYYTTGAQLDVPAVRTRIAAYAAARGWQVEAVEREEAAALPIATGGSIERLWASGPQGVGRIGMGAGLFQPMTGYSLPDAVRTAALVAALPRLDTDAIFGALRDHAFATWRARGFYRLLARMMFEAAVPAERYRTLRHFYRLDEALIARFYAGRSTALDKARILCGKPPVPVIGAARVLVGRKWR